MSTTTSGHVTRTFEAATPHLLQALIGVQDANLKQIVEAIPVRILSRSGKMLLTGEPAEVKIASDVIEAMQNRLMNNLPIDKAVIGNIIESALSSKFHQPSSSSLDEYIDEVVGFKGTDETIPVIKATEVKAPVSSEKPEVEKSEAVELEIDKPVEVAVSDNSDSVEQTETVQSESELTETPVEEKEETPSVIIRKKPARKKLVKREKSADETALQEDPTSAKFITCSPMSVHPRSHGQAKYLQAIERNDLVFCSGPAGSGKTYLAVAMALHCLQKEIVRKIVLVRPAVEAGEKLGFLPGDMLAKVNPFLRPLLDALRDMIDYEQVKKYMEHDVIEIVPLAFMRGRTLNDTFMILDEAQNTTITQMKMFLTRMGTGSKVIVTGDETQNDLPTHVTSGLTDAMKRLKGIRGATSLKLDGRDIVRHRLVRDIVQAYDDQTKPSTAGSFR